MFPEMQDFLFHRMMINQSKEMPKGEKRKKRKFIKTITAAGLEYASLSVAVIFSTHNNAVVGNNYGNGQSYQSLESTNLRCTYRIHRERWRVI